MKKTATKLTKSLSIVLSLLMILSVINMPGLKAKAAGTVDDFVERCYTVTLDRGSDPDGFADWKGQLLNGKAVGIEIAYGFLFSKEYTNKNKDNDDYLKDLYMLFMGREPDEGGYNDWMGKLNNGASRLEVFAGFANSQEFYNICDSYGITAGRYVMGYDRSTINNVNLFVERMYKITLNRIGDKDGQKNWVEQLINKQITGSECARRFIFSQEYTNKNLGDEEFVENLYLAMFGRPSDADGKNNWLYGLKNGMTRDEVFAGFANSVEFDNICKTYGINRGTYTATNKGTFDKDNPNNQDLHPHVYDQKKAEERYLKNAATCTKAAEYYYSCECGERDANNTFTSGKALGHEWDTGTVTTEPTLTEKGVKTYKCNRCSETKNEEIPCILASAKAGDIIKFGTYEQDLITTNGKEDIEWQVLSNEKGKVLVVSEYCLDVQPYNKTASEVTWETCSLRKWLNNDFINEAFSEEEKKLIPKVTIINDDNPFSETDGGNNTKDKVFCLSYEEVDKYFGDFNYYDSTIKSGYKQSLICSPTNYAVNKGVHIYYMSDDDFTNVFQKDYGYTSEGRKDPTSNWWLRTPGYNSGEYTCFVGGEGVVGGVYDKYVDDDILAVRPALYLEY